jgi:hypothetical protein
MHAFFVVLNRLDVGIDGQRVADQVNPFLAHRDQGNAQDAQLVAQKVCNKPWPVMASDERSEAIPP